jgi:hypothetical protein
MGWLVGAGVAALAVAGFWYWRSRSAAKSGGDLRGRLECGIANVTTKIEEQRAAGRADLVDSLELDLQQLRTLLEQVTGGGTPNVGNWFLAKHCPSVPA